MLQLQKTFICTAAVATVVATSLPQAHAGAFRSHRPIPSWYVSLSGSLNYVDDTDLSENVSGTVSRGDFSLDEGAGLAGAIGYRPRYSNSFWDNTRIEAELGTSSNDVGSLTSTAGALSGLSGNVRAQRAMVNAYLDFDAGSRLRPYIGGGVGAARIDLDNDEDTVFAYQGMAGMYYVPTSFPLLEFGLGYRYFQAPDVSLTSSTSGGQLDFDYTAHSVEATIRAYF